MLVRIPVTDLVDHPGATRALAVSLERAQVDDHDDWGPATDTLADPLVLDLMLESVVEGILVRGTIQLTLHLPCGRCLVDQERTQDVTVGELFVHPRRVEEDDDPDDYRIDADLAHLDLGPMLRDTVVMAVPVRVLCRDDCRGLCPTCGTDRNLEDCGHRPDSEPDPRWAALADLDLPPS
jgi:uncharacterized protein